MMKKPNKIITSKYTPLLFLPLNLYKQFSRYYNIFFLITLILLLIPSISPFTPYTYLLALIIVVGVAMIHDGVEDYKRHKDDKLVNKKKFMVLRKGEDINTSTSNNDIDNSNTNEINVINIKHNNFTIESTLSEDLKQGDIIVLKNRDEIPCDSVILNSKIYSHKKYSCRNFAFIETSTLDGEANLKKKLSNINLDRKCKGDILNLEDDNSYCICSCDLDIISKLSSFEVNPGGEELYDIDLVVKTNTQEIREKKPNILLRGSTVQNIHNVLALITSVGKDTKLSKNIQKEDLKKSTFENKIENKLFYFFVFYFIIMIITSIIVSAGLTYKNYISEINYFDYYILLDRIKKYVKLNENALKGIVNFYYATVYYSNYFPSISLRLIGTNYILYSYLIPLSLFVMIEISKIFQSKYINSDKKMIVKRDRRELASGEWHDSSSRDENGEIKYFRAKCRNSGILEDLGRIDFVLTDKTGTLTKNEMYFKYCDVGNGLVGIESLSEGVYGRTGNIYDEILADKNILFSLALLCCNSLLVVDNNYEGTSQDEVSIVNRLKEHGMVLVDRNDKEIIINLKLNVFIDECINDEKDDVYAQITKKGIKLTVKVINILDFSSDRKRMSIIVCIQNMYFLFTKGSDQQLSIKGKYNFVKSIDENSNYRSLLVAYKELREEDLITQNIENKQTTTKNGNNLNALTDECVLEEYFKSLEQNLLFIGITFIEDRIDDKVKETISSLIDNNIKVWIVTGDKKETALCCARSIGLESDMIISGNEFMEEYYKKQDAPNISQLSGVIYRAIPDHKAKFANYLKEHGVVLAIGDGGNDVSMINIANVGVGIMGKEGSQASLSSDISLLKFCHLDRLIFYHGKNNFIRTSKLVVNSFYKNLYLISFQFFYNFNNNFTGKSLFNYFFLNYYNILFTSFIPLFVSIFDKYPEDYSSLRHYFSNRTLLFNMIYAIFKAAVLYYTSYFSTVNNEFGSYGLISGYSAINNYYSALVFYTILIVQLRSIHFITPYIIFSIFLTLFLFYGTLFGIQDINNNGDVFELYSTLTFYILIVSSVLLSVILDRIVKKITNRYKIIMY